MNFIKYQHIEKFGSKTVENIQFGECYIFPKLDGSNGSIWYDKDTDIIYAGSRNRVLSLDDDNAGFYKWVLQQDNLKVFFKYYPNVRLYGEWLVPHTLKTYRQDAWNKFYVFDVWYDKFIHYDTYQPILEEYKIDYIPPLCIIKHPSYDSLIHLLNQNIFLIQDGNGSGEGIIIKNYTYINKYNKTIWAKIVKNEFREKHNKNQPTEINASEEIEFKIVRKHITATLVEKEYAKIIVSMDGWESKYIPRLFDTVYYCLITEDLWDILKEYKFPTINFKTLKQYTIVKIKELMPTLF